MPRPAGSSLPPAKKSIDDATQVAHQTAEAMDEAQKAVADLAVQARGLAELIVDMKN